MQVFSVDKYVTACNKLQLPISDVYELDSWPMYCDGLEVVNGKVGVYTVVEEWCVEVPDNLEAVRLAEDILDHINH